MDVAGAAGAGVAFLAHEDKTLIPKAKMKESFKIFIIFLLFFTELIIYKAPKIGIEP